MNRRGCLCLGLLILLAGGCRGEPRYIPTLTKTGPTIDAVAESLLLYPEYALLSGKEPFRVDAASVERVESSEFTRQIKMNLSSNLMRRVVFTSHRIGSPILTLCYPDESLPCMSTIDLKVGPR